MRATDFPMSSRRLMLATFAQNRAAAYTNAARYFRNTIRSNQRKWIGFFWWIYPKGYSVQMTIQYQTLAEAYSLEARLLMGLDE